MPRHLDHAVATASYRAASEDRAVVIDVHNSLVVLVADGAGGIPGGGSAADVVIGMVQERAPALVDAAACARLLSDADSKCERVGETTAVLLIVTATSVVGSSCGDSEAWLVGADGTIDDVTEAQHRKRRVGSGRATPVAFEGAWTAGATLIVGSDGLFRYAPPMKIAATAFGSTSVQLAADALVQLVRTKSGDLLDDVVVVVGMPACSPPCDQSEA